MGERKKPISTAKMCFRKVGYHLILMPDGSESVNPSLRNVLNDVSILLIICVFHSGIARVEYAASLYNTH